MPLWPKQMAQAGAGDLAFTQTPAPMPSTDSSQTVLSRHPPLLIYITCRLTTHKPEQTHTVLLYCSHFPQVQTHKILSDSTGSYYNPIPSCLLSPPAPHLCQNDHPCITIIQHTHRLPGSCTRWQLLPFCAPSGHLGRLLSCLVPLLRVKGGGAER